MAKLVGSIHSVCYVSGLRVKHQPLSEVVPAPRTPKKLIECQYPCFSAGGAIFHRHQIATMEGYQYFSRSFDAEDRHLAMGILSVFLSSHGFPTSASQPNRFRQW